MYSNTGRKNGTFGYNPGKGGSYPFKLEFWISTDQRKNQFTPKGELVDAIACKERAEALLRPSLSGYFTVIALVPLVMVNYFF